MAAVASKRVQSRKVFGRLMKRWRCRQGWTQYTAHEWAQIAGFKVMSYGNLSVMERGVGGELRFEAFFNFEEMFERLHTKAYGWGQFPPAGLKALVTNAQPLLGNDGKPWSAIDMISCYIGRGEVPTAYQLPLEPPAISAEQAVRYTHQLRLLFRRVVKQHGLSGDEALHALEDVVPAEHWPRLKDALLICDYRPSQLQSLYQDDDDEHPFLPDRWIAEWQEYVQAA